MFLCYRKFPKYSDTQKIRCNHSKIWTMWLFRSVMSPNDADGMANSVDPDQTAPLGAVWSGSALFAQAYMSENLGSLRYSRFPCRWISVLSNAKEEVLLKAFQDTGSSPTMNQSVREFTRTIIDRIRSFPGNRLCCDCGAPGNTKKNLNSRTPEKYEQGGITIE